MFIIIVQEFKTKTGIDKMQIQKTHCSMTQKLDTFGNKISYTDITEYSIILDKNMT